MSRRDDVAAFPSCQACDLGWSLEDRDGVWWHESPTGNVGWICRIRSPEAVSARAAARVDDNRLTRSQQRALGVLTMADEIKSLRFGTDGTCYVAIGESHERWMVTRRGRRELVKT